MGNDIPEDLLADAIVAGKNLRWADAIELLARALAAGGNGATFHYVYGTALLNCNRISEALEQFKAALLLAPDHPDGLLHYALALELKGRLRESETVSRRALELDPGFENALINLGLNLMHQGRVDEALLSFGIATSNNPEHGVARDNFLLCTNYVYGDGADLLEAHRTGSLAIATDERKPLPIILDGRKIRVGYVSGDFGIHSVSYFLWPIVENHDRRGFEVFLYSSTKNTDALTELFAQTADRFVDIAEMDANSAAAQVEADKIDILVDLSGHTANNRLDVFQKRPAPVQATWIGYPATTGCDFIDYRIVDEVTDPSESETNASETLVRLSAPFLCYTPAPWAPAVSPPPLLKNGHVTFGSFNATPKISPQTVELWAEAMRATDGSRLFLKSKGFGDEKVRERYAAAFGCEGIALERLSFSGLIDKAVDHLNAWSMIDIALDTHPYNGTTTTCEALWMGVPTISLAGRVHASRVGATLLRSVGLGGLAVDSHEKFVQAAVLLSADQHRLASLRQNLRGWVAGSPLCDARRLVKSLEDAYRKMLGC